MLKRIGVVAAALAACSSQDDVTQVTAPNFPGADARGNPQGVSDRGTSSLGGASLAGGAGSIRGSAPAFIWAAQPATPGAAAKAPAPNLAPANVEQAARAILVSPAAQGHFAAEKVDELELHDLHDTGVGAVIARFDRRVNGIEVFGQYVSVAMDRSLEALALSGDVGGAMPSVPKAAPGVLASGFALQSDRAVLAAIADVSGVTLDRADLGDMVLSGGEYESYPLTAAAQVKLGTTRATRARARVTLFPTRRKELVPAYYVESSVGPDAEGRPRNFAHVVSAADGSILWKKDQTAYEAFTYRVYADAEGLLIPFDGPQGTALTPHPGAEPIAGLSPEFAASQLVTLSSLESVGVTDPWLPDGARETSGNNVDAYLDITDPDGFTPGTDFRGRVSAPNVFDTTFDPAIDATGTNQQTAAVTQLFYNVNWFHDWYYAAGFDEASGNAQRSNFERGGVEGDPILAEAQDNSGTDNANMFTPADGESPKMQMFLWNFGPSTLTVTGPASIAGEFAHNTADFSPPNFDITGPIVRAAPIDACTPLQGDFTGAIVLADRGGADNCGFAGKAANAQAAGAAGILIANVPTSNAPETAPGAGGEPPVPITIGVFTLNLADGDKLRAALEDDVELGGTMVRETTLRDGDVDNQIVAHEWGHYISNRLVGNSSGLDNTMGSSLGEGWGDFHALLMTVRPEDTQDPTNESWNGVYGLGGYASGSLSEDGYYFGVRRYPYSTDLTKNPLTFKHISNDFPLPDGPPRAFDNDHTEVHSSGEVWASMLWECYASLLRDTLGTAPRLTFEAARDRMRDYLVAAYKLTPLSPTLLEARDALLAAALARDPVDVERFSEAFAKRGAGVFAVAPDRFDDTNSGVVESYAFGAAIQATSASLSDDIDAVCVEDGVLDSNESGTLRVTFRNVGNAASEVAAATVTSSAPGVVFPDGPFIAIPPMPLFGTAEGSVRVSLEGFSAITPVEFSVQVADIGAGLPPATSFGFVTNADQIENRSFTDTAESTHVVWSVGATPGEGVTEAVPESALWRREATTLTEHLYQCPSAPLAAQVDFTSPVLQVERGEPFTVTFRHRYSFEFFEDIFFDGGVIEITDDGGATWRDVGPTVAGYPGTITTDTGNPLAERPAFVGVSPGYPANFLTTTLDLGTQYGGEEVQIRFKVASDAGVTSPGWEIDDIALTGVSEAPFDAVVAQPATCSNPAPSGPASEPTPPTPPAPPAPQGPFAAP